MYPKYRLLQGVSLFFESYSPARHYVCALGEPSSARSAVFLNIVQKAFDPPPLRFEHYVANFF